MARLQRGHSAIAPTPEVSDIRPLTRADLGHLTEKREPTVLKSLRDSHHRVARALASGMSNTETCANCGISSSRLSTLKTTPSFQELVAHYRSLITTEWVERIDPVNDFIASVRQKSLAQMEDALDEAEEKNERLPVPQLLRMAEITLDRSGYGKINKNINVNVDFAAKLEAARQRSDRARESRVIDGTSAPVPPVVSRSGEDALAPPRPLPPKLRRL